MNNRVSIVFRMNVDTVWTAMVRRRAHLSAQTRPGYARYELELKPPELYEGTPETRASAYLCRLLELECQPL
jgi:hypothetical protein